MLELRQHYSVFRVAERLLELLKPITPGDGQDEDDDELAPDPEDHYEELVHLLRWLKIDRFDRRATNRELAQVAMERVA